MKCEYCGREHDGSYGSGRFCCENCKQSFVGLSERKCTCKYCGKEFRNARALGGHINGCKKNPHRESIIKTRVQTSKEHFNNRNPISKYILKCQVCGEIYTLELRKKQFESGKYKHCCSKKCAHSRYMTEYLKKKISDGVKSHVYKHGWIGGKRGPNKQLLNENNYDCIDGYMINCTCEQCNKSFSTFRTKSAHKYFLGDTYYSTRFCSKECSDKHKHKLLSEQSKTRCDKHEFGGKNNETYKKHKHGWYNGIYCGSSYELAFVLYYIDMGYVVKRCELKLQYEYKGKIYNYYPDFEINNDIYEIKGFEDYKAKAKHEQHPYIKWINKELMKPILKYVKEKYGKDFVRLLQKEK